MRATSAESVTSATTALAEPPISCTAEASRRSSRPATTTVAPSAANAFAVARPMPELPPVTRTILPANRAPMLAFFLV